MNFSRRGNTLGGLLTSPEVYAVLVTVANGVAARARAGAPVDSGEYVGSIHVESQQQGGGKNNDRAEARVVATADHAAAVEFGNSRSRGRHVLRGALRSG